MSGSDTIMALSVSYYTVRRCDRQWTFFSPFFLS